MAQIRNNETGKGEWAPTLKDFKGIPLFTSYKYLGTVLEGRLSVGPQLSFVRRKIGHLFVKLYPYLLNTTADGRRDMWQTFVAPLFNATIALMAYEGSEASTDNILRLWRRSFKWFLIIPQRTPTELVTEMIGRDLLRDSKALLADCKSKWTARTEYGEILSLAEREKLENPLKGVPNELCALIKTSYSPCTKCF